MLTQLLGCSAHQVSINIGRSSGQSSNCIVAGNNSINTDSIPSIPTTINTLSIVEQGMEDIWQLVQDTLIGEQYKMIRKYIEPYLKRHKPKKVKEYKKVLNSFNTFAAVDPTIKAVKDFIAASYAILRKRAASENYAISKHLKTLDFQLPDILQDTDSSFEHWHTTFTAAKNALNTSNKV